MKFANYFLRVVRGKMVRFCYFFRSSRIGKNLLLEKYSEISVDKRGKCVIGKNCNLKFNSKVYVRKNAIVSIGDNFFMNRNCMITALKSVQIGNNVQFGPGVLIYDHDHDYKKEGYLTSELYINENVVIGNNVWIGANCVILKGTYIPDNCVVAAGTILKGKYKENSLIYTQREIATKNINRG